MCLILFAFKAHPKYKLVVAANRDEFYARPTAPAQYWDDEPDLLAGRDLTAGGTWMGISKTARIGMLTNYRDLRHLKPGAPSRGHLVSDYLNGNNSAPAYLKQLQAIGNRYNGFNIICGTPDDLYYYGNYGKEVKEIAPGYHGLSNALLDTSWPKVDKGVTDLKMLLNSHEWSADQLFKLLYDDLKAPDERLPDTGVGLAMERMLSPMFIKSPNYGSRCSTLLLIDQQNNVDYIERTYNIADFSYQDSVFNMKW